MPRAASALCLNHSLIVAVLRIGVQERNINNPRGSRFGFCTFARFGARGRRLSRSVRTFAKVFSCTKRFRSRWSVASHLHILVGARFS